MISNFMVYTEKIKVDSTHKLFLKKVIDDDEDGVFKSFGDSLRPSYGSAYKY